MNEHNENIFFKIIIPNYNNISYIKKCLDSILDQTFRNFKIIIIDNVSDDLSDKFCEMYARKYPDKIIFKQNVSHIDYEKCIDIGKNTDIGLSVKDNKCVEYVVYNEKQIFDKTFFHDLYLKITFKNADYIYQYKSKAKNIIHVLIVNFANTINYTKSLICDLLVQYDNFDLTIIDNNSDTFDINNKYFNNLYKNWKISNKNRSLRIIGFKNEIPLNTLWNLFYYNTTNQWLCFLNNDICIPVNFISDNIKVIKLEKNTGIINHCTNKREYKISDTLSYKIYNRANNNFLHRQGWDFTINKNLYTVIPDEFSTYCGDNIQFYNVYKHNKDVIFIYSSPIIHYCSVSTVKNINYYKNLYYNEHKLYISNERYEMFGNKLTWYVDKKISDIKLIDLKILNQNIYCNNKKIIISLTTWKKRISNIPVVLDSILNQTHKPDKIIINLSKDEFINESYIPINVLQFIHENNIKINWVDKNTKVYKKIIPTLLKYKHDLILSIDDDFIYPDNMIQDFYNTYLENPNRPISGNRTTLYSLDCHCGCASMVQYKFYNVYIENYMDFYENCPSSDIFFTFIANLNGYKYVRTKNKFFLNMQMLKEDIGYSVSLNKKSNTNIILITYKYLKNKLIT